MPRKDRHLEGDVKILDVPEKFRVTAMVQLGYAAVEPPVPLRKALDEIVSYEHF
jgi:nitroreductase